MGPPPAPSRKASSIKAQGLPAAEARHKPPHLVVSELGEVDHLDEEAVSNSVEPVVKPSI